MMTEQEQEDCENPCCAKDRLEYEESQRLKVWAPDHPPCRSIRTPLRPETTLCCPAASGRLLGLGFRGRRGRRCCDGTTPCARQRRSAPPRAAAHSPSPARSRRRRRSWTRTATSAATRTTAQVRGVHPLRRQESIGRAEAERGCAGGGGAAAAVKQWQQARLAQLKRERGVREQLQAQHHGRLSDVRRPPSSPPPHTLA
jgi:hypothetical protein